MSCCQISLCFRHCKHIHVAGPHCIRSHDTCGICACMQRNALAMPSAKP